MHFSLLAFALVASLAEAIVQEKSIAATSTEKHCSTVMGKQSVYSIPTQISHHTRKYTVTYVITQQPTRTITPKPVTLTQTRLSVVRTSTVLEPTTDTVQVNAYETTTFTTTVETFTSTQVVVESTDVVVTPTSTKPAPANYTPVQDTLPDSSYRDSDPGIPAKRDVQAVRGLDSTLHQGRSPLAGSLQARKSKPKPPTYSQNQLYPQKVQCGVTTMLPKVVTSTRTGKKTSTIYAPTPVTKTTKTRTVTITDTIYPPHVTTETTSTITLTNTLQTYDVTTTATTITSTNTVQLPEATVFAQCADRRSYANYGRNARSNFEGYVNGWSRENSGPNSEWLIVDVTSDFDCCNACAGNPRCEVAYRDPQFSPDSCRLFLSDGCAATGFCGIAASIGGGWTSPIMNIVNGPVGQWNRYFSF